MSTTTPQAQLPGGLPELIHTTPLDTSAPSASTPLLSEKATVNYLAYGSNLSFSTFTKARGIVPLVATKVTVPSIYLVYNLAGLPYVEPAFANISYEPVYEGQPCVHGVVYTITEKDFARLIATEGGGSSYTVIDIPCVPYDSSLETMDAKTLYVPPGNEVLRMPPPEASLRYMNLLRKGAGEHGLDEKYRRWLDETRSYTVTSWRQKVGRCMWMAGMFPVMMGVLMGGRVLADKEGKVPGWWGRAQRGLFWGVWAVYDGVGRRVFGDGERTVV